MTRTPSTTASGEGELREALTELRFAAHTFGQLTHAFNDRDNRKEEMQHLFVRFREDVSKLEKHLRATPTPSASTEGAWQPSMEETLNLAQAFLEAVDDETQVNAGTPDQLAFEIAVQTAKRIRTNFASPQGADRE